MTREDLPAPHEGFVLTHYLAASDFDRSRAFYADVLGGQVVLERNDHETIAASRRKREA